MSYKSSKTNMDLTLRKSDLHTSDLLIARCPKGFDADQSLL